MNGMVGPSHFIYTETGCKLYLLLHFHTLPPHISPVFLLSRVHIWLYSLGVYQIALLPFLPEKQKQIPYNTNPVSLIYIYSLADFLQNPLVFQDDLVIEEVKLKPGFL